MREKCIVSEDKLKELEELQISVSEQKAEMEESEKLHFESDVQSLKEAFIQKLDETEASQKEEEFNSQKSKDQIKKEVISLHKDGFNDVEIAKKCGIGIGEIKLILGLYDGV